MLESTGKLFFFMVCYVVDHFSLKLYLQMYLVHYGDLNHTGTCNYFMHPLAAFIFNVLCCKHLPSGLCCFI